MSNKALITRVVLRNYKSFAACDVQLGELAFLVGPNGSGKSNFLDALRLVAESLNRSLDHALRDRGGIKEVRRRSGGHPTHFGIRLEFVLPEMTSGYYAFNVGSKPKGGYEVQSEVCRFKGPDLGSPEVSYKVREGNVVESTAKVTPAPAIDRLYLVTASGLPEFRPVYDALTHMGFYNLNPDRIRELQSPDAGEMLARDGMNLASVLAQLKSRNPELKQRIEEYLSKIVPGVTGVEVKHVGPKETLEFRQEMGGSEHPWRFVAANMSDGTLRALGILAALFQNGNGGSTRVHLVGIEEPEIALHPAAAGVVRDCLMDASAAKQVIVTSHSPDLLDDHQIPDHCILPVVCEQGATTIGPMDEAGRTALRDRLYTPGELLRLNQLTPDQQAAQRTTAVQRELFGDEAW